MYNSALITGASSGIGEAFAKTLAKQGYQTLLLVARREERLKELSTSLLRNGFQGRVFIHSCDLRLEEERVGLKRFVESTGVEVELLINNAGFGYVGKFHLDNEENQRDMISTNCLAPVHLTQLFLPSMIERKTGAVINVASIAGYPPLPYMATYGATKAFLLNWSVALNQELKAKGVKILALCPGPTESEFHIVAGVKEKIEVVKSMSAEMVVLSTIKALEHGQSVVVPGIQNKFLVVLTRAFSKPILALLGEKILQSRVPVERR